MYAMSGVLVVPDYLVTTTGNAIVVTDLSGNGDTLTVSEPSADNIKFAAAGRLFSINGGAAISGDSGDLSRASVASITVNAAAGADIINVGTFTGMLPSLTINGGTGNDSVNFVLNVHPHIWKRGEHYPKVLDYTVLRRRESWYFVSLDEVIGELTVETVNVTTVYKVVEALN